MNPLQMMSNMSGMSGNNPMQMIGQIQQFMRNYKGNPQEQIQSMLNSGQISQDQYNQAVQMASGIAQMMGIPRQ